MRALPAAWVSRRLVDCGPILAGGTPSKGEAGIWGGDRPWISAKSLKTFDVFDSEDRLTEAGMNVATIAPAGSVLFVVRGMSLAKEFRVGVANRAVAFNQDLRALRPKSGVDSRCLARYLKAVEPRILSLTGEASHGTKRLTSDRLAEIPVPLPPLAEQRRIADILDRADAMRVKRREAIALLDGLGAAAFAQMFGDVLVNDRQWPEGQTLGDVADVVSGVTKGRNLAGVSTREVPYLAVSNVQDMRLNLSVVKTIPASEEEIARYRLQAGDIVLTEGGDPDKLGRGTLWRSELPECIHQNHVFRVRVTADGVQPLFLNLLLGSARGKRYFLRSAKQTTGIASINTTQLKGFPILLPPFGLQCEFAERIAAIDKLKASPPRLAR